MKTITEIHETTPERFKNEIAEKVLADLKIELQEFSKNFQPKISPEFIESKEACQILGVTPPTLLDWRKRNIVTAYKIANKIRFKRSEIENSLKKIDTYEN